MTENQLEVGEVYRIKTTGEQVTVLSTNEGEAVVRRPIFTSDVGTKHVVESYLLVELETTKSSIDREWKEMCYKSELMKERDAKIKPPLEAVGGPIQ